MSTALLVTVTATAFLFATLLFIVPQQLRRTVAILLAALLAVSVATIVHGSFCHRRPYVLHTEGFDVSSGESEVLPSDLLPNTSLYFSTLGKGTVDDEKWVNLADPVRSLALQNAGNLQTNRSLRTLSNEMEGPPSHDIGLRGEDSFTLLWHAAFPRMAAATADFKCPLFEAFANTHTNTGFRVELQGVLNPSNTMEFYVVYSQGTKGTEGPYTCRWQLREVLASPMTYALIRDANNITLRVVGVKDLPVFDDAPIEDILLSNRRVVLNRGGKLDADIYVFAVVHEAVPADFVQRFDKYVMDRKNIITEAAQRLVKDKEMAEKKKKCPLLEEDICKYECAEVKDWTNAFDVMTNATPLCKSKLLTYCQTYDNGDPDNICSGCFLEKNKDSEKCKNLKTFLEDKTMSADKCNTVAPVRERNALEPSLRRFYQRGTAVVPRANVSFATAAIGDMSAIANQVTAGAVTSLSDRFTAVPSSSASISQLNLVAETYTSNAGTSVGSLPGFSISSNVVSSNISSTGLPIVGMRGNTQSRYAIANAVSVFEIDR